MKQIKVWFDETSDYGRPKWIVSIGDEDTDSTIAILADRDEAIERGLAEATARGLALVIEEAKS